MLQSCLQKIEIIVVDFALTTQQTKVVVDCAQFLAFQIHRVELLGLAIENDLLRLFLFKGYVKL